MTTRAPQSTICNATRTLDPTWRAVRNIAGDHRPPRRDDDSTGEGDRRRWTRPRDVTRTPATARSRAPTARTELPPQLATAAVERIVPRASDDVAGRLARHRRRPDGHTGVAAGSHAPITACPPATVSARHAWPPVETVGCIILHHHPLARPHRRCNFGDWKRVPDWCRPRSSKPMKLCASSGLEGSIPLRFRHIDVGCRGLAAWVLAAGPDEAPRARSESPWSPRYFS